LEEHLNDLTLMSIERDILRHIQFDKVINAFANAIAREAPGLLWTLRDSIYLSVCV